jgi:hypothetical protein
MEIALAAGCSDGLSGRAGWRVASEFFQVQSFALRAFVRKIQVRGEAHRGGSNESLADLLKKYCWGAL